MRRFFRENWKLLRRGRGFLQFELLYKLIGIAVVTPGLLALFRLSIRAAGLSYITNDNVFRYLSNPLALLVLLLTLIALACYVLTEMAAMAFYFHLKRYGKSLGLTRLLGEALRCAGRVFRPRNLLMVPFLILMIPFTSVALVSGYLTTIRVPEFIVRFIILHRYVLLGSIGVLAFIFFLSIRWIFSIHYFALEQKPFLSACHASAKLVRKRYFGVLGRLLLWEGAAHGLLLLLYLLFLGGAFLISRFFVPGTMGMTVFLETFHWLNLVLLMIGSCMTIPIVFTVVSSEFYRLKYQKGEKPPLPRNMDLSAGRKWVGRKWSVGITLLLIVSVLSAGYILPEMRNGSFGLLEAFQQPHITAHRGSSSRAPENTLAALEAAVEDEADCVELDVQQLADGTIILMHDSNFRRTTGVSRNVWEVGWEEVQTYDAGSWFSPEFEGERIPTLEEFLQAADGRMFLNIEIKATGREQNLEEEVIRIIREQNFEDQCVITSLQYSVLQNVKAIAPELQTGYILSVAYGRFYDLEDADLFSVRADFVTETMVRALHDRGKLIYVWTVNDTDMIEKMNELRVDDIITDEPRTVRAVVSAENTNETFLEVFKKLFTQSSFSVTARKFWKAAFEN